MQLVIGTMLWVEQADLHQKLNEGRTAKRLALMHVHRDKEVPSDKIIDDFA